MAKYTEQEIRNMAKEVIDHLKHGDVNNKANFLFNVLAIRSRLTKQ